MSSFDQKAFRNALGAYATGITVITASSEKGHPVGLTANSFTSVSLDPPLVLWCLANSAESYNDFVKADYFSVHVLHKAQQSVSEIFATRNGKKFDEVPWKKGDEGTPVLNEFLECFHCRKEQLYEGGDHVILLGEVVRLETRNEDAPLLYHQGQYNFLAPKK